MMDKNYRLVYEKMAGRIRESGAACFWLRLLDKAATGLVFVSYPVLLALLLSRGEYGALWRAVLVPGTSFFALTALRAKINRPRPYEAWEIDPIIKKDTKGKSMPSRHVFSSAVIAMAWLAFSPSAGFAGGGAAGFAGGGAAGFAPGAAFLLISAAAAVIRVLGGVHYPSDVAAGFAAGILAGTLMLAL